MRTYTPKEFGAEVGVTYQTLIKWEKKGIIVPERSTDGRRYYTEEHLQKYFGSQYTSAVKNITLFCRFI